MVVQGMLFGSRIVVAHAANEPNSIAHNHAQITQLFGIGVSALCSLASRFDGSMNGRGALFGHRFNQGRFVMGVYHRSSVSGNEFSVGNRLIHRGLMNW